MFNRIPAQLIPDRIDPGYYSKELLANEQTLESWNNISLEDLVDASVHHNIADLGSNGNFAFLRTIQYSTEPGLRYLRTQDVDENSVSSDDLLFVANNSIEKVRNSIANIGDLVVCRKGKVGAAAIVPADIGRCCVSENITRFVLDKKKIDSAFCAAFLNSRQGAMRFAREATGVIQSWINNQKLRKIRIVCPSKDAQSFVGDMVRCAERFRGFATTCESAFADRIKHGYPNLHEVLPTDFKHGRATCDDIGGSLNPGAFNPDRLHVRRYLKNNRGKKIKSLATVETPVTLEYRSEDWYIGLDSIGSALGRISPSSIGEANVTGSVRVLSEGTVISKLRPYLNKVAYIPSHLVPSYGSTELLRVCAKDPELNWYLCGVLQLKSTVRQLNPVSTGSTHPRVSRDDILDCYVPWIDDASTAGNLLADAQKSYFLSDKLLAGAKLLVEALIDRRISESQLSDAQSQLTQGSQSGHREVLGRLYEGGVDAATTRPLFPDLDAYYETLQMAEQALADGGDE